MCYLIFASIALCFWVSFKLRFEKLETLGELILVIVMSRLRALPPCIRMFHLCDLLVFLNFARRYGFEQREVGQTD